MAYRTIVFIMFSFLMAAPISANAQDPLSTPIPDGYYLVFEDEFRTDELDTTKWQYRYTDGHEYGEGIAAHEAVQQPGDGYLHLVTSYRDGEFLTGMIRSVDEFRYGYFEARIQFHKLQGHHGAFWLQSPIIGMYPDDPGRSGAEVDIIEYFGDERINVEDAQQNVYWNAYVDGEEQPGVRHEIYYREEYGVELSADFHTFALLWTPDEYVFFIDGAETWRTTEGLSHVDQYIVLSLATSDWDNPKLVIEELPDEMLVDYVRVYAP